MYLCGDLLALSWSQAPTFHSVKGKFPLAELRTSFCITRKNYADKLTKQVASNYSMIWLAAIYLDSLEYKDTSTSLCLSVYSIITGNDNEEN